MNLQMGIRGHGNRVVNMEMRLENGNLVMNMVIIYDYGGET